MHLQNVNNFANDWAYAVHGHYIQMSMSNLKDILVYFCVINNCESKSVMFCLA